jgi:hypothetical protein
VAAVGQTQTVNGVIVLDVAGPGNGGAHWSCESPLTVLSEQYVVTPVASLG